MYPRVALPAVPRRCITEISQILDGLCHKIAKVVFRRFPRLGEVVLEMTKTILAREQAQTTTVVENIVRLHERDSSGLLPRQRRYEC